MSSIIGIRYGRNSRRKPQFYLGVLTLLIFKTVLSKGIPRNNKNTKIFQLEQFIDTLVWVWEFGDLGVWGFG